MPDQELSATVDMPERQEDTGVEAQPQNPAQTNGNGAHYQQPGIQKQITEKYMVTSPPSNLMGRINNRPPYAETVRAKNDRDFLEELMIKPESNDYLLSVNRYQPSTDAEGNEIPRGMLYAVPVMYYDDLVSEISNAWGGGAYRVTVTDKNGSFIDSIRQCVIVQIPTTQYPPKHSKYEKIETGRKVTAPESEPISDNAQRLKQVREEAALRREEERLQREREADDVRREEYDLKRLQKQKELQLLRESLLNPPKKNDEGLDRRIEEERRERAELQRKQEEERKEERRLADERRKEDQQRHESQLAEERRRHEDDRRALTEQINRLADKINQPVAVPPPDNGMKDIMMGLIASTIGKQAPPDNSKELIIELNKANQQSSATVISALAQKPQADPNDVKLFSILEKFATQPKSDANMPLMQTLITALVGGKNEKLTPQMMMELMRSGKQDYKEMVEMMQGIAPQNAPEVPEDDWDPSAGFLGNAGKAIFHMLKQTVAMAATNPQMMQAITAMFGKRQPTEQEIVQQAMRMEHGTVPALTGPMQVTSPYQPTDQQLIPYQPQAVIQPQLTQRPGPRPIPNTQPQAQVQTSAQPAANPQQQQIVNELEGEAGGLPTNADPEPQTPEQMAKENLRFNVTDTMEIMLKELSEKAPVRTWPKHATETWNQTFKQQLVKEPSEQRRIIMIAQQCDDKVWADVRVALQDGMELSGFYGGLRQFIDMNSASATPAAVVPVQVQTATPAPQAASVAVQF